MVPTTRSLGTYFEYIKNVKTFTELTKFFIEKPQVIPKYFNELCEKIDEFGKTNCETAKLFYNPVVVEMLIKYYEDPIDEYRTKVLCTYANNIFNESNHALEHEDCYTDAEFIFLGFCLDAEHAKYCPTWVFKKMLMIYMDYDSMCETSKFTATLIASEFSLFDIISWKDAEIESYLRERIVASMVEEGFDFPTAIRTLTNIKSNINNKNLILENSLGKFVLELGVLETSNQFIHSYFESMFTDDLDVIIAETCRIMRESNLDELQKFGAFLIHKYRISTQIVTLFFSEVYYRKICRMAAEDYTCAFFSTMTIPSYDPHYSFDFYFLLSDDDKEKLDQEEKAQFEKACANESTATEGYDRKSRSLSNAQAKIYNGYRAYKDKEAKIDSQITKTVKAMGKVAVGDARTEVIEGKSYTALGLLKKLLGTVAIFSIGPIKSAIALVIRYAVKKNTTMAERRKIIYELNSEISIIEEKIEDAKNDQNKKAKYAMMRTRAELIKARDRIQAGMGNDEHGINLAKTAVATARGDRE